MITLADLQSRIGAVRRKERRVVFLAGTFRTLVALVAVAFAYFLMDWVFELPYVARLIFATAGLGAVGYVIYKHLIRELRRIQDDDEIALRVEARNADLHGRLISTLQLTRGSKTGVYVGSPELIAALEAETTRMSEPLDFFRIINTELVIKFGVAAALVVAIKVALVVKFPEYYSALGTRLVHPNAHFPTKTHLKTVKATGGGFERNLFPGSEAGVVPRGEELLVEVTIDANYIPQQSGVLAFKSLARDVTVPIELAPAGGLVYKGTLSKALEDMDLTVGLGDAKSEPLRIRVLARPEVDVAASGDCIAYTLPAYTGQREPLVDRFGGLSALIGSTARVRFRPTKALASARLERSDGRSFLLEKKTEAGAPVAAKDGKIAQGQDVEWWELASLPLEKNASFHMSLTDVDGLRNSEPPVEYPIEARPDLPPTIKLLKPARDMTVTPQARLNVSFVARDDWAVRTVWVVYRVQTEVQGEGGAVKRLERAVPHEKNHPAINFAWDIAALGAKVGDQIIFWLEADDDCTTNNFLPATRVRRGADVTPAPAETAEKQEVFPRSSDVKLTVVSREEKLMELQAEVERLYQQLVHAKENQEELKAKVLLLLEEIAKLKGGN